ncbi:MAG: cold shock domain-containing protein [Clostridia bacterium]
MKRTLSIILVLAMMLTSSLALADKDTKTPVLEGTNLTLTLADNWETEDLRPGDPYYGIAFVAKTEDDSLFMDIATTAYDDMQTLAAYKQEYATTYGEENVTDVTLEGYSFVLVAFDEGEIYQYTMESNNNSFLTASVYGTKTAFEQHKAEIEQMLGSLTQDSATKSKGSYTGIVQSYDRRRRSGRIRSEADGKLIYVHNSSIITNGEKKLEVGQRVRYDLSKYVCNPRAINVTVE